MKLIGALDKRGIELIAEGAASASGGRGVRLRETGSGSRQIKSAGKKA
jgi:hypothetical protein